MNYIQDNQLPKHEPVATTHGVICTASGHNRQLYTRIRVSDLKRLAQEHAGTDNLFEQLAKAELDRRGYEDNKINGGVVEVSNHALDSLSLRHMHRFLSQGDGRGIAQWCLLELKAALAETPWPSEKWMRVTNNGMTFILQRHFKYDRWVLVTIE
jgi:hypothetical protein